MHPYPYGAAYRVPTLPLRQARRQVYTATAVPDPVVCDLMNLLESVVKLYYYQAGLAVGLLQGSAYAAAEACHAVGFTEVEQQLRWCLPDQVRDDSTSNGHMVLPGQSTTVSKAAVLSSKATQPQPLPAASAHLKKAGLLDAPASSAASPGAPKAADLGAAAAAGAVGAAAIAAWPGHSRSQEQQQPQPQEQPSSAVATATAGSHSSSSHGMAGHISAAPPALSSRSGVTSGVQQSNLSPAAAGPHPAVQVAPRAATAALDPAVDVEALQPAPVSAGQVEFIPLTGPFEPTRLQDVPADTLQELQGQQHLEPAHAAQQVSEEQPQQQGLGQGQQQPSVETDLMQRLSSFALDRISPTTTIGTTATTLALAPEDFGEGGAGEDVDDTGMDMAIGPLEAVEGEMDMSITNSTGSNLLPKDSPLNPDNSEGGGLAATVAAAAAAVTAATTAAAAKHDQNARTAMTSSKASSSLQPWGVNGSLGTTQSGSGEYKIGLPAQRHLAPLARSSSGSTASDSGSHASLSAQFNACFTRQTSIRQQYGGEQEEPGVRSLPGLKMTNSSSSSATNQQALQRAAPVSPAAATAAVPVAAGPAVVVAPGSVTHAHASVQNQGAVLQATPSKGSKAVTFSDRAGDASAAVVAGAADGRSERPAAAAATPAPERQESADIDMGAKDQRKRKGLFGRFRRKGKQDTDA